VVRNIRKQGLTENTNGLIRQYFPKGTDFRDVRIED
jgi:IS30 family transposase